MFRFVIKLHVFFKVVMLSADDSAFEKGNSFSQRQKIVISDRGRVVNGPTSSGPKM